MEIHFPAKLQPESAPHYWKFRRGICDYRSTIAGSRIIYRKLSIDIGHQAAGKSATYQSLSKTAVG